jgi:hypothetical protein
MAMFYCLTIPGVLSLLCPDNKTNKYILLSHESGSPSIHAEQQLGQSVW